MAAASLTWRSSVGRAGARVSRVLLSAAGVVGIELLAAAQGCDFRAPLTSSAPLARVRALLREQVSILEEDRYLAADIAAASELVLAGAVARAVGELDDYARLRASSRINFSHDSYMACARIFSRC